ncbi:outer membrane protein [Flavobacteriaceae bacterium MAR_2010_72]|nr:outer membrane protein [Flavobacteriaceae bacterium MAR_2010_72]
MHQKFICSILVILNTIFVYGQTTNKTTVSLEDCIEIALNNNLDLKASTLRTESADINFRQSKNALLPSVNGNYNIGKSTGRSIDPFTNSYINEELTFSNAGLSLDAIVFNGFRLINSWKQQKFNLLASEMEQEEARQNLILNVTLAYLQVMNTRDLLNLAENRIESTEKQLERLKTMFDNEMGNPAEFRDFQGQMANDKANLMAAKNNYQDAKLNLKQLLNIKTDLDIAALDMPLEFNVYGESFEEVYDLAIKNLARVKADTYRLDAAHKGVAVAKSQYVPQVSLFANLGTNYSSAAKVFNQGQTNTVDTGDFVTVNGQDYSVFTQETQFIPEDISYRDQFDNNLNTVVGLAVSIPVFNGFRAKNNVALEKIREDQAAIELDRTKLELHTVIEQTYNDMLTAFERFKVLEEQVVAYEESLRINEIRFNNGANTSVDYIISKNNHENAQISLNNVKYEYILRVKLLEYYKGNI